MNEEIVARLQEEGQKSKEIEERLEVVDQQLSEMEKFNQVLEGLENRENDEMLASIGKGVYVKTKLSREDLYVDVGSGVVINKSMQETKKIIEQQKDKLHALKTELNMENESQNIKLRELIEEIEKDNS